MSDPSVVSVSVTAAHTFSKPCFNAIELIAGVGVLGDEAVVEVTGLRNPCVQLDDFQPGLMAAVLDQAPDGALVRKAGIMSVVLHGGEVRQGDAIRVVVPDPPHRALERV